MSTKTAVYNDQLLSVIDELNKKDTLIFDTETSGLKPYHASRMFSLAIGDLEGNAWYFNFKKYADHPYAPLEFKQLAPLMTRPGRTWVAHNAKFDLHFCDRAGIKPEGKILDTQVMARLFENHHQFAVGGSGGYSLKACATRWLGEQKDDAVMEYMKENGCFSNSVTPTGASWRDYHFDLVPFDLISDYAMQDAIVTAELYKFLRDNLYETEVLDIEANVTEALFEMEKRGLLLDRTYCEEAKRVDELQAAAELGHLETAIPGFTDSAKFLGPYFEALGVELPQTEKGNPQLTDKVLRTIGNPLAERIMKFREYSKRASYWSNYIYLPDDENVVHPSFMQAGTATGRLSCKEPNLQNIPAKDTKSPFPVRRAFIPRDGFIFVSIDYAQMEFRLMLDYAGQKDLIEKIKAGHDPHDATAELTGLDRKAAKTLNFGLLYGMGIAKLAEAINCSFEEARSFKYKYFGKLPKVKRFIYEASDRMEARGYTYNLFGRRFILEDKKWAYKAANAIIQGGCADICKLAMVRLRDFLGPARSRMVLQVHDEILFEVHKSEIALVAELRKIMEEAYSPRFMPLTCSVSWSLKSFGDLVEVMDLAEIRP